MEKRELLNVNVRIVEAALYIKKHIKQTLKFLKYTPPYVSQVNNGEIACYEYIYSNLGVLCNTYNFLIELKKEIKELNNLKGKSYTLTEEEEEHIRGFENAFEASYQAIKAIEDATKRLKTLREN